MKRITIITAVLAACIWSTTPIKAHTHGYGKENICAGHGHDGGHCSASPQEWKAKMMEHRTAYITEKLGLTPAEAKKFWPVYGEMTSRRDEAFKAIGEAFKKLDEAITEGRPSADIERLFDEYMAAQDECSKINAAAAKAYRKVLSKEKVARLFVIEENFRRNMISRLNKGERQDERHPNDDRRHRNGCRPEEHR